LNLHVLLVRLIHVARRPLARPTLFSVI
jgi:hypothetical protein